MIDKLDLIVNISAKYLFPLSPFRENEDGEFFVRKEKFEIEDVATTDVADVARKKKLLKF